MAIYKVIYRAVAFVLLTGGWCAGFTSCTSVEDEPKEEEELVPITLGVESDLMADANNKTRTAINDASSKIGVAIWEGESITDDFLAGNAPMLTTATLDGTNTNLELDPVCCYNPDGVDSNIFAYYPADGSEGVIHGTSEGDYNVVTFGTLNGTVDVCASAMVSANKMSENQPTLGLEHKTAWITFQVKKDSSVPNGTNLKTIYLSNAKVPGSMTLTKSGVIVTPAQPKSLRNPFVGTISLSVMSQEANTCDLYICPCDAGTLKITAGIEYNSKITTQSTNLFVEIKAGYHYEILLTFVQSSIIPTVSVTPWTTVNGTALID